MDSKEEKLSRGDPLKKSDDKGKKESSVGKAFFFLG